MTSKKESVELDKSDDEGDALKYLQTKNSYTAANYVAMNQEGSKPDFSSANAHISQEKTKDDDKDSLEYYDEELSDNDDGQKDQN